MVQSIRIQNFKSIVDLEVNLGQVNVFIGENGCGKTNILEAIAFGAAACADKLDYEFLGSRGIRVTSPAFMVPAFSNGQTEKVVKFSATDEIGNAHFELVNDKKNIRKWVDRFREKVIQRVHIDTKELIANKKIDSETNDVYKTLLQYDPEIHPTGIPLNEMVSEMISKHYENSQLSNYLIYALEESSLRKFGDNNQIYPLGRHGEGLFQYLKDISQTEEAAKIIAEIKEALHLLDWYDGLDLAENTFRNDQSIKIKDRYLHENLQYFDQQSTNEGFLYLMFYATLFASDLTPTFFAIDNIDTAFNPKMCVKLMQTLVQLAKKHNKQVIITTHNPAILDGLDLQDLEQKLFVVRRNDEGHTKIKNIPHKSDRTLRLSEIWTNGYIGGLPENF